MPSVHRGIVPVDPSIHRLPARREMKRDPLAEHRRQLARQPVSPELAIMVRAAGYRGPVLSQLHAIQLLGFALRDGLADYQAMTEQRGAE